MSGIDHSLFKGQSEDASTPCPKCSNKLEIKYSAKGPFLGCSQYPTCDFTKPLSDHSVEVVKDIDDAPCPQCGSGLQIKKGRYGLFIGCSAYPQCDYIAPSQEKTATEVTCPSCGQGKLVEKTNRYGKRFFSCTRYPDCRYVVNFAPVPTACPACGWSIMVRKAGKLHCPQKQCRYSQNDDSIQ